jgi:hypothetical protein
LPYCELAISYFSKPLISHQKQAIGGIAMCLEHLTQLAALTGCLSFNSRYLPIWAIKTATNQLILQSNMLFLAINQSIQLQHHEICNQVNHEPYYLID